MANRTKQRRDAKHRVLRRGESIRDNGKYQFKYQVDGKPHFVYSWRLEPTDPQPVGKKPCLSLRELEKQIGYHLDSKLDPLGRNITVEELINRYLATKTGVKPNTQMNYNFVRNLMKNEPFNRKKISEVKVSDAKLFLIKLQQDGKGYSTVKTVRGVLRPAFQMAMDDDLIIKNPFGFQLAGVVVNDSVTREAIKPDEMRKFLKFVHDDNVYCKYYEVVFILFHTGMRISEFCGLTIRDLDMENRIINIDHQLQRIGMTIHIESTKTNAGTRKIPMPEVAMHWEHRFNHMVGRYNEIYRIQIPNITPHVCRHTYCSNMARAGMNPKTLQYLMGHSDIGVTMNTYTHLGLEDAQNEMIRLEELNRAKEEVAKAAGEKKPVTQRSFRAV